MNGLFPFIINSLLGGINGYQSNNMNLGNNNIMDMLARTFGNQGNLGNSMMGSVNNNQGNNNIVDIIGGLFGNQGNTNMMGGAFNNQDNNIADILGAILGGQTNNNMMGRFPGNQGNNNMGGFSNNQRNSNMMGRFDGSRGNNVGNSNNNKRNKNRNRKNNINSNINSNINNGENNILASSFNNLFNQTFAAVVNNQDIIESIVDNVLNSDLLTTMFEEVEKLDMMNIELKEYSNEYIIEGKLPGVNKKDIDLDYDEEVLTIKVKNNQLFTNGTNRMIAIMQPNSDIEKKFLVNDVDKDRILAEFKSDVLRVYLPKKKRDMVVDGLSTIIDVENYILD